MGIISEIIGYPLGWLMWLIFQVVKNYTWSIVIFTLITKLILVPISVKQQKSTAAMAALNPKLEKLKKQYAKNQEKLQEEQMKLYNEEGVNPMASCLPLAVQMFILYGIFDVVYRPLHYLLRIDKSVIESAKAIVIDYYGKNAQGRPEIYIIKAIKESVVGSDGMPLIHGSQYVDLISKVNGFDYTMLHLIDFGEIPTIHPTTWNSAAIALVLIPILSGVFQLIFTFYSQAHQKKINPDMASNPSASSMNIVMYSMPLFSVWIAFKFPAGIGFYWMLSSVFSLVQQVILNKIYTPEYVEKLIEKDKKKNKNKKKSGLMARYEQMMKDAAQYQQNGTASNTSRSVTAAPVSDESDDNSDVPEVKLSKSKQKEYERTLIREARKRMAEKYGDEYTDDDSDD